MKAMKAMKTMKAAARKSSMSKGGLADALAKTCELKKSVVSKVLDSLAGVAAAEVKKTGVFTIPGVPRLVDYKRVFFKRLPD
jgi:hypothetical protein